MWNLCFFSDVVFIDDKVDGDICIQNSDTYDE